LCVFFVPQSEQKQKLEGIFLPAASAGLPATVSTTSIHSASKPVKCSVARLQVHIGKMPK
jgi:hypothetical protein